MTRALLILPAAAFLALVWTWERVACALLRLAQWTTDTVDGVDLLMCALHIRLTDAEERC